MIVYEIIDSGYTIHLVNEYKLNKGDILFFEINGNDNIWQEGIFFLKKMILNGSELAYQVDKLDGINPYFSEDKREVKKYFYMNDKNIPNFIKDITISIERNNKLKDIGV